MIYVTTMRKQPNESREQWQCSSTSRPGAQAVSVVFKGPVQSGFSAKFQWTGTTTSWLLWENLKDQTETEKNQSKPVHFILIHFEHVSDLIHKKVIKNI